MEFQLIASSKGKLSGKRLGRNMQTCKLIKKAEMNAKSRESYHQKKAKTKATQNDTQNLGIIFTTRHISMWSANAKCIDHM